MVDRLKRSCLQPNFNHDLVREMQLFLRHWHAKRSQAHDSRSSEQQSRISKTVPFQPKRRKHWQADSQPMNEKPENSGRAQKSRRPKKTTSMSPAVLNVFRAKRTATVPLIKRWDDALLAIAKLLECLVLSVSVGFYILFKPFASKNLSLFIGRNKIVGPITISLIAGVFSFLVFSPLDGLGRALQFAPSGWTEDMQQALIDKDTRLISVTILLVAYLLIISAVAYVVGRFVTKKYSQVVNWVAYSFAFFIVSFSIFQIPRVLGIFTIPPDPDFDWLYFFALIISALPLSLGLARVMLEHKLLKGRWGRYLVFAFFPIQWAAVTIAVPISSYSMNYAQAELDQRRQKKEEKEGTTSLMPFDFICERAYQDNYQPLECKLSVINVTSTKYSVASPPIVIVESAASIYATEKTELHLDPEARFEADLPHIINPGESVMLDITFIVDEHSGFCDALDLVDKNKQMFRVKVSISVAAAPKTSMPYGGIYNVDLPPLRLLNDSQIPFFGLRESCKPTSKPLKTRRLGPP